jgi:DNA repair exonuclease SbcCD ATPase subunit
LEQLAKQNGTLKEQFAQEQTHQELLVREHKESIDQQHSRDVETLEKHIKTQVDEAEKLREELRERCNEVTELQQALAANAEQLSLNEKHVSDVRSTNESTITKLSELIDTVAKRDATVCSLNERLTRADEAHAELQHIHDASVSTLSENILQLEAKIAKLSLESHEASEHDSNKGSKASEEQEHTHEGYETLTRQWKTQIQNLRIELASAVDAERVLGSHVEQHEKDLTEANETRSVTRASIKQWLRVWPMMSKLLLALIV